VPVLLKSLALATGRVSLSPQPLRNLHGSAPGLDGAIRPAADDQVAARGLDNPERAVVAVDVATR